MMRNPVIQEALSIYGSAYEFRRFYIFGAAAAAAVLALLWPAEPFAHYVLTNDHPVVFDVVATLFPLALALLSGMIGLNGVSSQSFITESEWVHRTPLSASQLFAGKCIAALVHTLFLVLLVTPPLILSGIPSGVDLRQALSALMVLASFTVLFRCVGLAFNGLFPRRNYIALTLLWVVYLALAFLTINRLPALHPAVAVLGTPGVRGQWHAALPTWFAPGHAALLHVTAALLFLLLYRCGILFTERRTRRHVER